MEEIEQPVEEEQKEEKEGEKEEDVDEEECVRNSCKKFHLIFSHIFLLIHFGLLQRAE